PLLIMSICVNVLKTFRSHASSICSPSLSVIFFLMFWPPTRSTLFPYTTLFRSYPRFPAPVEFIAAVIAYYVHPVNIQTACLIMEGAEFTENIINGVERPVKAANNVFRKFSAFHDETGRLNVD